MIESRLDSLTDGTGGGYGNYPGLTVAQVAERFRALAEEGHNRSVRAILRIVHEQTAARGTLQVPAIVAGLAATVSLVLLFVYPFVDPEQKRGLVRVVVAGLVSSLLFGLGALSVQRTASRNVKQVREIRRLALLALEQVVNTEGFVAKSLEREHLRSLDETRKIDPERWRRIVETLGL